VLAAILLRSCHHCNTFVPERDVPGHPCWDTPPVYTDGDSKTTSGEVSDHEFPTHWENLNQEDEVSTEEAPSFVEITDEVEQIHNSGKCFLCLDRMGMEYNQDLENWVYRDCVLVHNRVVHKDCYMIVRDDMTQEKFIQLSDEEIGKGRKQLESIRSEFDY